MLIQDRQTAVEHAAGAVYRAEQLEKRAAEAQRLAKVRNAGAIPEECGPAILAAPARGGFVLHRNLELLPVGDKVEAVHRGYGGRSAIRRADVFDAMIASAQRRKQPWPLTPGQIAIGRRYADLVMMLKADGTKLSRLDASTGSADGGNWMDHRLELSDEVATLRKRIGPGIALSVRRVRPSDRGDDQRGPILDRVLVDMVCVEGRTLDQVLKAHGWSVKGSHRKSITHALSEALDRMIGYRAKKSP
ncbi:hypothetical protein RGQ15_07085 [Paracoccus sp. MBLB3053]|uniref:Uncharacterized protein n=1 Tax=Paracoccus aurantius TaxID=3073814 RepID=A0ABU2HQK9_9RHOB|nr:hypothetical protein [Paracoccus sp. MBLB3053]MDS9467337.1 hypothetical protein [Paracoccus sp. MBLB3053]